MRIVESSSSSARSRSVVALGVVMALCVSLLSAGLIAWRALAADQPYVPGYHDETMRLRLREGLPLSAQLPFSLPQSPVKPADALGGA